MNVMDTQTATNGEQGGIKRELALIPAWAYALAAIAFICIPLVFYMFVWPAAAADQEAPPKLLRIVIPLFPATVLGFLSLMIGYVNRDAGRRGMSRTLWTLIVIFIPNAIGFILYFLLRNPIQMQCPKCSAVVDPNVNYCPQCRYNFHPTCPQCKTAVRPGATFCTNCGVQLDDRPPTH